MVHLLYLWTVLRMGLDKLHNQARSKVLLLSGGGAFGALQVGMLRPFIESGFKPDIIVGVSAGALNGSFISNNWELDGLDSLAEIWSSVAKRDIFPSRKTAQLLHIVAGHNRLHQHDGLRGLIERVSPVADLSHSVIPVKVGATNLVSGDVRWFSQGAPSEVLLASCSLPGLFPPVEIDGVFYIDGGVVSNVPWGFVNSLAPSEVVCLDAGATLDDKTPDTALGVLLRSFAHTRAALQSIERSLISSEVPVWHVKSPVRYGDQGDFSHASTFIKEGESLSRSLLESQPYPSVLSLRDEAECIAPRRLADRVFKRKSKGKRNAYGS